MINHRTIKTTRIILALGAIAALASLAVLGTRHADAQTQAQPVPSVPVHYSLFARGAAAPDQMPASLARGLASIHSGTPPSIAAARRAPTGEEPFSAWAVPMMPNGSDGSCIAIALPSGMGGATCSRPALEGSTRAPGSFMTYSVGPTGLGSLGPNSVAVAGIVPDGVASVEIVMQDGRARTVEVREDSFAAVVTGDTAEVDYTLAGVAESAPLASCATC